MRVCCQDDCGKPALSKGLCSAHYQRLRKYGRLHALNRQSIPCNIDDCRGAHHAHGLCPTHHKRWEVWGDPYYSELKYGSGTIDRKGYRWVVIDGVRVQEHRWVMSQMIDRALFSHESVHHKNGDRSDNRRENLELWSTKQPYGQRVEDKVRWAKELLALYDPSSLVDGPQAGSFTEPA
jgi:hypothetical protein